MGMKVEVKNQDSDSVVFSHAFLGGDRLWYFRLSHFTPIRWRLPFVFPVITLYSDSVATVLCISGYHALLRFGIDGLWRISLFFGVFRERRFDRDTVGMRDFVATTYVPA